MALAPSLSCHPATFNLALFGAQVLEVQASLVSNFSESVPSAYRYTQPSTEVENATFCNVTVTYTHPGENDTINGEAWLPIDWNGRFQAVGGGGWVAGRFFLSYSAMAGAMGDGYATITTDAGLGSASDPSPWALVSPGNVNLYKLQDLGSVSLWEQAVIGKSVIESYYGQPPSYSYWNGCSQGGRQGLMVAQRYPTAYDGIAAGAPANYWGQLVGSIFWPQQWMNMLGKYPYGCEIDAITDAAISFCDKLDDVEDGLISNTAECLAKFDPFQLVGQVIHNCSQTNTTMRISEVAASVSNATWSGRYSATGRPVWPGLNIGSDLTGDSPYSYGQSGLAATNCTNGTCVGAPSDLGIQWLSLFIEKDPNFDASNLTLEQFDSMIHAGVQQYDSIVGTSDPDLREFQRAGGKMLTFHGMADQVIPTGDTEMYYRAVMSLSPDARDFYRVFQVPGLGHCFGGRGGQPTALFAQLRAWVENDTAPESSPFSFNNSEGEIQNRILCPYPEVARFESDCGSPGKAECWSCVPSAQG